MAPKNRATPLEVFRYDSKEYGESFVKCRERPGTMTCTKDPTKLTFLIGTCMPLNHQEAEKNIARFGVWFGQDSPYNTNGFEIGGGNKSHHAWNTAARLKAAILALKIVKEDILSDGGISQIVVVDSLEHFTVAATERVPKTLHNLSKKSNPSYIKDNATNWRNLLGEVFDFKKRGIEVVFHTERGGQNPDVVVAAEQLARDLVLEEALTDFLQLEMGISEDGESVAMKDYTEELQDDDWADVNFPDWRQDFNEDFEFLRHDCHELNKPQM
jgi:hypothetical protein